jgi:hypothetical protein
MASLSGIGTGSSSGGSGSFIPQLATTQTAPTQTATAPSESVAEEESIRDYQARIKKQNADFIYKDEREKVARDPSYARTQEHIKAIDLAGKYEVLAKAHSATKINDQGEEEDKFDLNQLALITMAIGAGASGIETLDRIINGNDIDGVDLAEELFKNTQAMTDPKVRQMIINASYGDQQALTDLENLTTYGNQFGSLSSDVFNGQYGEQLEQTYQEFLKTNPGIGRDQFLVEFARQNPTSEISQDINQKLSRFGQLARGASEYGQIDRNTMLEGFGDASKFYQPVDQGGYGFSPDQFRSQEQNRVVNNALGLMDGPEAQMLRQNAMDRVSTGGKLGTQELQQISADSLASVDPSLQAQPYIRSGGLAQSMINTEQAQRRRLMEDESSLYKILNADRNYAGGASNVVNQANLDPVKALGLQGSNSSVNAGNMYQTNPTGSLNYDPTNSFASSVLGQNVNIAQANQVQPGLGANITAFGESQRDLDTAIKNL